MGDLSRRVPGRAAGQLGLFEQQSRIVPDQLTSEISVVWAYDADGRSTDWMSISKPWSAGLTVNDVLREMSELYLRECNAQGWTPRDSYYFEGYDFETGYISLGTA